MSRLEQLHEESLFVLASVALHKNLSATELAATLRLALPHSTSILQLLRTRDLLRHEEQRYSVSVHWYREVIRHLRRRRLLLG